MDRRAFIYTLAGSAASLAATELAAQTVRDSSSSRARWDHLKYAIYFCNQDIEKLLVDPAARKDTLSYFAPVRAERFYLEAPSDREVDVAQMRKVIDALLAEGIKTSGAMVPTAPDGPTCFNNPEHLAIIDRRARSMASLFDEVILDDWLFTVCTCEKCVFERGASTWADYRTQLLLDKSRTHIIEPAKRVNPKIKVIIKFPNWYESHRHNGYDVEREIRQFDAMAVGIETRTRAIHDQHIPIYSAFVFQKWWPSAEPQKWVGSWLDNYEMQGQDNDYVAQVWQAVLAQTPEIILWSAGQLHRTGPFSDVYPHFRAMLPEFDRVAGLLRGSTTGIPIHLPYGSQGEYNIFGHLGMAGVPLSPVAQFPSESKTAIFTRHSLREAGLADKMLARLRSGRDVFMTWGLYSALQETEFRHMLSVLDRGGSVSSSIFRGAEENLTRSERAFSFPRIMTTTWPDNRRIAAVREDYDFAVLLKAPYLTGNLYVLNVPENSYDLIRLPEAVLNGIRASFTAELGVQLKGPGGVGLYPFTSGQYVLYNMRDEAAQVALSFDGNLSTTGWRELVNGKALAITETKPPKEHHYGPPPTTEVALRLQPFEIAIVQRPAL